MAYCPKCEKNYPIVTSTSGSSYGVPVTTVKDITRRVTILVMKKVRHTLLIQKRFHVAPIVILFLNFPMLFLKRNSFMPKGIIY